MKFVLFLGFIQFFLIQTDPEVLKYDRVSVGCLIIPKAEKQYIINSYSEYSRSLTEIRKYNNCFQSEETIDFSSKTLIGFKVSSGGCNQPTVNVKVTKEREVVTVTPIIKPSGICRAGFSLVYWIIIDKTPSENIQFSR